MIIKCIFLTLGDTSPALRKLHTSHPFSKVNLFWFPSYTCRKLCQAGYTNHLLGLVHINHINVFALLALGGFQVEMAEVGSKTSLVSVPILVLMWVPLGFSCPCQWAWTSTSGALSGSSSSIYFWKMLRLIIQLLKCEGKAKRGLEPEKKKKSDAHPLHSEELGGSMQDEKQDIHSNIWEISRKYPGNIQEMLCSEATNSADPRGRRDGTKGWRIHPTKISFSKTLQKRNVQGLNSLLCPSTKAKSTENMQKSKSSCDKYFLYSAAPAIWKAIFGFLGLFWAFPAWDLFLEQQDPAGWA